MKWNYSPANSRYPELILDSVYSTLSDMSAMESISDPGKYPYKIEVRGQAKWLRERAYQTLEIFVVRPRIYLPTRTLADLINCSPNSVSTFIGEVRLKIERDSRKG